MARGTSFDAILSLGLALLLFVAMTSARNVLQAVEQSEVEEAEEPEVEEEGTCFPAATACESYFQFTNVTCNLTGMSCKLLTGEQAENILGECEIGILPQCSKTNTATGLDETVKCCA